MSWGRHAGQLSSAQKLEQAAAQPGTKLVLIWDLDETLVVFNSLLTGSWAAAHGLDRSTFSPLGERWERAILDISDKHFLYEQVRAKAFQLGFCWTGTEEGGGGEARLCPGRAERVGRGSGERPCRNMHGRVTRPKYSAHCTMIDHP